MTGLGVGDRDTDKIGERGAAPMPANSDQQGGKSGKIHFIKSSVFILALVAGLAPNMFSIRTLRESLGTPAPPGRSIVP